ncbi:MAG TPA: Flp family type IVb pilin [Acidocella sp.]|nr:Flp family type IVb pilin [Acidocella sp.]
MPLIDWNLMLRHIIVNNLKLECQNVLAQIRHALILLRADNRAVTAIEYALIAALIAVVIVGAATQLGTQVSSTFNNVSSEL